MAKLTQEQCKVAYNGVEELEESSRRTSVMRKTETDFNEIKIPKYYQEETV